MKTLFTFALLLLTLTAFPQENDLLYSDEDFQLSASQAVYQGIELYNAEKDLADLVKREGDTECPVDYAFFYNPLSLVGPYYSFEANEGGVLACGKPGNSLAIRAVNITTGAPAELDELFSETSIFNAFMGDSWIQKQLNKGYISLDKASNWEAAVDVFNQLDGFTFTTSGFAILKYDAERNLAAVRFVGVEYVGSDHNMPFQLGLWLEPLPAFQAELENHTRFTLGKFDSSLTQ